MSNYANTKATIAANVYTNHNNEVTAEMVKTGINAVVDSLIAGGFLYKGVAHPGDPAITSDANIFVIATEAGTYTNFKNSSNVALQVADGEVAILKYNGSWSKEVTGAATAAEVSALGHEVGYIGSAQDTATGTSIEVKVLADMPAGTPVFIRAACSNASMYYYVRIHHTDGTYNQLYYGKGGDTEWHTILAKDADYAEVVNFGGAISGTTIACNLWTGAFAYDKIYFKEQTTDTDLKLTDKVDKVLGTNLVDVSKCVTGYINIAGVVNSASAPWAVSDYIPVNGQNIIGPYTGGGSIASYCVYDKEKVFLRGIQTAQYTYQPGDVYVRMTFSALDPHANYGTTLVGWEPYTPYLPSQINANKLIKLVGMGTGGGSAGVTQEGDTYYNTSTKLILRRGANPNNYCTIPYYDGAIYTCNGEFYIWNGTDLVPVSLPINQRIDAVQEELESKLDKIIGTNLVNPAEVLGSKYFNTSGNLSTATDPDYSVSGFISVFDEDGNGRDIIANAAVLSYVSSYVVYGADKTTKLRYSVNTNAQYTYQSGDYFVRFCFFRVQQMANAGTTLASYVPYTDYKPLADLKEAVETSGMAKTDDYTIANIPNYIYSVYNSILTTRQTIARLYMAHLFDNLNYKNGEFYFENFVRNLRIIPTSVSTKQEISKTIDIIPKSKYINKNFSTKFRITDAAASKAQTPRILVIGDSVTDGYGANSNKDMTWFPNQYCGFAKMFFEMDKIDGGDNAGEYNALFLGSKNHGFTINYGGVSRAVRAKSQSQGGAALNELFNATWGGDTNPFYDSVGQTFSMTAYLAKYRTMDDAGVRLVSASADPHGESVVGSDGITYTIGTEITTQALLASVDVCTPTIVVINLVHNTSLANYEASVQNVVNIIQTDIPGVKVGLMVIDETGTYFPVDYPNYDASQILYSNNGLHHKNNQIYDYILNNVEDEANDVYLLGAQFIQPTAESYPTIGVEYAELCNRDNQPIVFQIHNPSVSGPTYHPNNLCHEAFGYALYAFVKWLIS